MKKIISLLSHMYFTILLLSIIGMSIHEKAYGQLEKLKKKTDKSATEAKKTDSKKDKPKEKPKEETRSADATTTSAASPSAASETKAVSQAECDDVQLLKSQLYWTKQYLTTYNDPNKADGSIAKCKEYLKQVKTNCPAVDVSSYEAELKEYEVSCVKLMNEANAQENAEKLLQNASYVFNPVLDNILGTSYVGMFQQKEAALKLFSECEKIDFIKTKKNLDDLLAKDAAIKEKATGTYGGYTEFMNGYKKFEEQTNTFIVKEINQAIEEAYAQKAKGKNNLNSAFEMAEAAQLTAKSVLLIIPDHTKSKALLKDAQSIMDAIDKELGASVYTSPFHKENAAKIVFSKSPITIKLEKKEALITEFTGNDPIYAMVYLKGPIESLAYNWECAVRVYVDESEKMYRRFTVSDQARKQSWIDLEIVPDAATSTQTGCVEYSKALSEVSPRNHVVKVEFWDKEFVHLLAAGEFNLDAGQGLEKIQATAKALRQKQLDKVRMPAAGMKNAGFEQKIMSDWKERYTPLRAVISSADWTIQRNALTSIIEHRFIWAAVAVRTSDGDCKIFYVSYKQPYTGSGYGALEAWGVGDNEEIGCANVNK